MNFVINVLVSSLMISFSSWLAGRLPVTAGFLVALPLATMLVLPLTYVEHGSTENAFLLARSIFIAIPVSMCFFLPFLLSDRLGIGFWTAYVLGCLALPAGFLIHRLVTRAIF